MALSLLVIAGSALGGLARYWLAILAGRLLGPAFPWGTFAINVLGSLLIGLAGSATHPRDHATFRAFFMVGICGGFTTFSSFSLQTLELVDASRPAAALAYVALSVITCLAGVTLGWHLGRLEWT